MTSKSELLRRANEEFPAHWDFLRSENPSMRLPARESFPTVTRMTVGEVTHRFGTEATLTLDVRCGGELFQLKGVSFENDNDTTCQFSEGPQELRQCLEHFAINLIFNLLCDEGLNIEEWQPLPD